MTPERPPNRQRQRPWPSISWRYSLLLVLPLLGFLITFMFRAGDPSGLSGVVKDAYTGKPVAGASISTANGTVVTDANGKFAMGNGISGTVTVTHQNYAGTEVAILPGQGSVEVLLRPTTIAGTVTNSQSGDPIEGAVVLLTRKNGQTVSVNTDKDGRYLLADVDDGDTLSVQMEGVTVATERIGKDARLNFQIRPDVLTGVITDENGTPVAGAVVSVGEATATTAADGAYRLPGVPEKGTIIVRRTGFKDATGELDKSLRFDAKLVDNRIKAIYVSAQIGASDELWAEKLQIAETTEINAIVLDLKDSTGHVFYNTNVPMAATIGAKDPKLDVQKRLKEMKDRGIYSIARIVCFEDPLLANARSDLAIHDSTTGGLWTTWNGLAWVNAHQREVWQYNIDLAVEAAKLGFDEVQLDYIRFPSDGLLENADYGDQYANETRLEAITGFLGQMQSAMKPTGSLLAVDIFGLTMWDDGDGGIGQNFAAIAPLVDIVCPMIYPSHFYPGDLGLDIPNNHPYEVIYSSLTNGAAKVPDAAYKLRPWLQDFSYGEGIDYGDAEVAAQIKAANDFGGNGWMLWSPSNEYHVGALAPK